MHIPDQQPEAPGPAGGAIQYPDVMVELYKVERAERRQAFRDVNGHLERLWELETDPGDSTYHEVFTFGSEHRVLVSKRTVRGIGGAHRVVINDEQNNVESGGRQLDIWDYIIARNARLAVVTHTALERERDDVQWPNDQVHGPVLYRRPDRVYSQAHPNYQLTLPGNALTSNFLEVMDTRLHMQVLSRLLGRLYEITRVEGIQG